MNTKLKDHKKKPLLKRIFWFQIAFAVLLGALILWSWSRSRSRSLEPATPAEASYSKEEAEEARTFQAFRAQKKRDELIKLTENSFFAPELKPLAGKPVLLAAGVEQWEGAVDDEQGETGDMVEFEVVQGKGKLAFFTDLRPGKSPSVTQTRLQTLALGGYEAFVWLLTEPGNQEKVVVRARLVAQGERKAFIDPDSQLLFHVSPVRLPLKLKIPSVRTLAENSFQKDRAPHREIMERDVLNYPGGQGVFSSSLKGIWFGPAQARVFQTDPSGVVKEAAADEEKRQWTESRQGWHSVPADLQGSLTHLDGAGKNWGFLSYSEAGMNTESGPDGFKPAKWIFERYRALMPEAGPEDQVTLRTFQDDPGKPVEIEIHRIHRSDPIPDPKGPVWGQTLSWTSEVANVQHIYGTIVEERKSFVSGTLPVRELEDEFQRVVQEAGSGSGQPREITWAAAGCSLRDFETSLEGKYREFGHPPGLVVGSVESSGPAALMGLQKGDVVVMIDWKKVPSTTEAEKILAAPKPEEGWPLLYWRKGVYQMSSILP